MAKFKTILSVTVLHDTDISMKSLVRIARLMEDGEEGFEGQFDIISTIPVPDDEVAEERAALGIYDEDSCSECGDPCDGGDGWDGKCGNCADKDYVEDLPDEPIAVAVLPDGTITDWDERLRMVDGTEIKLR